MIALPPPTREEVAALWMAVARGDMPREIASQWSEPLVTASDFETNPEVLVMQALQYIHGSDMTYRGDDGRMIGHGPPGQYVKTLERVAQEFDAWVERCADYDADPAAWLAARRSEAEAWYREEQARQEGEARSPE